MSRNVTLGGTSYSAKVIEYWLQKPETKNDNLVLLAVLIPVLVVVSLVVIGIVIAISCKVPFP